MQLSALRASYDAYVDANAGKLFNAGGRADALGPLRRDRATRRGLYDREDGQDLHDGRGRRLFSARVRRRSHRHAGSI